jgi:hypothetical protein
MRRRVKAQSTPPKALRSFPPPAAAAEDTSGSAIAVASSPRVRGAGRCGGPRRRRRPRDPELGAPVPVQGLGDLLHFLGKPLRMVLLVYFVESVAGLKVQFSFLLCVLQCYLYL